MIAEGLAFAARAHVEEPAVASRTGDGALQQMTYVVELVTRALHVRQHALCCTITNIVGSEISAGGRSRAGRRQGWILGARKLGQC
jgi:hypothetical protein